MSNIKETVTQWLDIRANEDVAIDIEELIDLISKSHIERIAQLERELAEWEERNKTGWIQELRDHAKIGLSAMRERDALAAIVKQMREALEIIAGKRQCIDNLLSNADIANIALSINP